MKRRGIGIMSGTSLDGIDITLADIKGNYLDLEVSVIKSISVAFEPNLKARVKKLVDAKHAHLAEICSLNVELSKAFASACLQCISEADVLLSTVDFIASHGQTIYHIGENAEEGVPSSLQLGDASTLSHLTGITVVSQFRQADIAVGGQGAPLVPYVDFALFNYLNEDVSIHNLGGISNLTVVPKSKDIEDVLAFDTGPANVLIDSAVQILFNKPYDKGGLIAQKGTVCHELLAILLKDEYLKKQPPKSTGRERYGSNYVAQLIETYKDKCTKEDMVATFTEFTAKSIALAYEDFVLNDYELTRIIFSGGGALNTVLLKRISDYLPSITIETSDAYGIDVSEKEALAFCVLGHETLSGIPSNIKTATGAKQSVVLGTVYTIKKEVDA